MVHNFKGKLLLGEESPAEQRPNTAMLNMGRMESPLEKYIASQVSTALITHLQSVYTPIYFMLEYTVCLYEVNPYCTSALHQYGSLNSHNTSNGLTLMVTDSFTTIQF